MQDKDKSYNPFFEDFGTPHDTIPFDKIRVEHYKDAFAKGMEVEKAEVEAICDNDAEATFDNTIVALERSGRLLETVSAAFYNLLSAESSDEMEEVAQELSPLLTAHSNDIMLNERLFERVKHVYDSHKPDTEEDGVLLENTYKGFVRSGANLDAEAKAKYRELNEKLSLLTLQFSRNLLQETNDYVLHIADAAGVEGLPDMQKDMAAETAREKGLDGYAVTLHAPSYIPFLTFAHNRDLRRELYMAYNKRCAHADKDTCNFDVVRSIVDTRNERARMLWYANHASYVLERRMAETPERVYGLLDTLIDAYKAPALKEVGEIEEFAKSMEGADFVLQPWDFAYYAHKLKTKRFDFDPEELRPYFELSSVKKGVLCLATRLYGITFVENSAIPVYHPDVVPYEVFDEDGRYLAVLYVDFHPRAGKKGGAWMTDYKEQHVQSDGTDMRPHVSLTMNFTKPLEGRPALLSFEEVETFLHEFGHALHSIFSQTHYRSLSGTNVYRDFVELPSQIMENFAVEPEFLNTFARHYTDGTPIPEHYIKQIKAGKNFNVAYACMRQVSFGLMDMAYYTLDAPISGDIIAFEEAAVKPAAVLPKPSDTCMSVQFSHIMAGGYSAGYYGYKWAEILDADAFGEFRKHGIFDKATASRFRSNILSRGGTAAPMELYKAFRGGQEPTIDALLTRDGIKK